MTSYIIQDRNANPLLSGWGDNDGEILYTQSNPRLQVSVLNRSPQDGWSSGRATYSIRVRTSSWKEWTTDGCPLFVVKVFATGGGGQPIYSGKFQGEKELTSSDCWRDLAFSIEKSQLNPKFNSIIIQLFVWNVKRGAWDIINMPSYRVDAPVAVIQQAQGGGLFGGGSDSGGALGEIGNLVKWAAIGIGVVYLATSFGPITRALSVRAADRVMQTNEIAKEERRRKKAEKAALEAEGL